MKSMLEKFTEYFENNSKEKILEDWKAVEKYSKIGPSVEEFISQAKALMETREEKIKWEPPRAICNNEIKSSEFNPDFFFIFAYKINQHEKSSILA